MREITETERAGLRELGLRRKWLLASQVGIVCVPLGLHAVTRTMVVPAVSLIAVLLVSVLLFMKYRDTICPGCGKAFFGEAGARGGVAADIGQTFLRLHCFSCGLSTIALRTGLHEPMSREEVDRANRRAIKKSLVHDAFLLLAFLIVATLFLLKDRWFEALGFGLFGSVGVAAKVRLKMRHTRNPG